MSCIQTRKHSLPWCAVLVLIASAVGCNSGGSGGSSTITQASSVRVESLTTSAVSGGTQVQFQLSSVDANPGAVSLAFSQDRGLDYFPATIDGQTEDLSTSESGITYTVIWQHNIDVVAQNQGDVIVRLTPRDEKTGASGPHSYSTVIAIGENNPPTIHSVETPTDPQGGEVVVNYEISDPQADRVELNVHYSVNGGASWAPATVTTTGDGIEAIPTSVSATTRSFSWFPQVDLPSTLASSAQLRLTARDTSNGNTVTTNDFPLMLLAPRLDVLTIGDIPKEMNGSIDYTTEGGNVVDFHMQVPPHGFELTLRFTPTPGGLAVDPDSISVTCDRAMGAFTAGSELGGEFSVNQTQARWLVPEEFALANGFATFTARVSDTLGNASNALQLEVEVVTAHGGNRPFDTVDLWWLDFGRDQFSIASTGTSSVTVTSSAGANGEPDFNEDLEIIGLRSPDPLPASGAVNTNAIVLAEVKDAIIGHLSYLYGGDPDGNGGDLYSPRLGFTAVPGGHRSSIRVGGDDAVAGYTLGRAHFDHRNATGNHNTSSSLGCFTTNFIGYYINSSSLFRSRFDPLIRGRGTPVGEDPNDAVVLHPNFVRLSAANTAAQNDRYDDIHVAIDALARAVGVILAHEIGHSIGLCSNGPLPGGLFGGVRGPSWSGGFTNSFHFDSPGSNIMAAALSFSGSISAGSNGYHFNEVNRAYLSEMILLR